MGNIRKYTFILFCIVIIVASCRESLYITEVDSKPYFGIKDPGLKAEIFSPGIISGPFNEKMISFFNKGTECYFQIRDVPRASVFYTHLTDKRDALIKPGNGSNNIYRVELSRLIQEILPYRIIPGNKSFLLPASISTSDNEVPLAFLDEPGALIFSRTSSGFSDWENEPIYYSIYRNRKWDISARVSNNNSSWIWNLPDSIKFSKIVLSFWVSIGERIDIDLKIVDPNMNSSYNELIPDYPVNTDYIDSWPTLDSIGNLYFFSNRPGGNGNLDIYFSAIEHKTYTSVINPGYPINTKYREHDPAISPDGSILVFASDRAGGFGGDDLYICYKLKDGNWTVPFNLGPGVNSMHDENRPVWANYGKDLFYSSNRSGNLDIYIKSLR